MIDIGKSKFAHIWISPGPEADIEKAEKELAETKTQLEANNTQEIHELVSQAEMYLKCELTVGAMRGVAWHSAITPFPVAYRQRGLSVP